MADEKQQVNEDPPQKPRIKRVWDEEARNKWEDYMETFITEKISDFRIDSKELNELMDNDTFVDTGMKKLKDERVRKYLYVVNVFVYQKKKDNMLPSHQRGCEWEEKYDSVICVQVQNEYIGVVLSAYLFSLNTFESINV
mmetsp:Transcript_2947/g.5470  ORF Transcript_2947/g.5470 Transcript_2947/m.5470 type:complete len:140 (+) Transcript_2947:60-479(+)